MYQLVTRASGVSDCTADRSKSIFPGDRRASLHVADAKNGGNLVQTFTLQVRLQVIIP